MNIKVNLKDGLYMITDGKTCAGFIVKEGRVLRSAPILLPRLRRFEGTGVIERNVVKICEGGCHEESCN